MRIHSIKFYVNVPTVESGVIAHSAKATYIATGDLPGGKAKITDLSMDLIAGPGGLLKIMQLTDDGEKKTFIYQLADILGRIEITE